MLNLIAPGVVVRHHDKQTDTYTLDFTRVDHDGVTRTSTPILRGVTYAMIAAFPTVEQRLAAIRQADLEFKTNGGKPV